MDAVVLPLEIDRPYYFADLHNVSSWQGCAGEWADEATDG